MLVLAFDTCFSACSAALFDARTDGLLAERFEMLERGHAEALPRMVAECLAESGCEAKDIQRIAVTRGPGTFTGLRVGLAYAHGMGTALNCEVVGLSSMLALALPVLKTQTQVLVVQQAGATGKHYAALLSAKAEETFVHFASADELSSRFRTRTTVIGTGADALLQTGGQWQRLEGHDQPRASSFASFSARLPKPDGLPQPLYLREPDAKPSSKTLGPQLRPCELADANALAKLHATSFDFAWTEKDFQTSLVLPGNSALIVSLDGHPRGFVQIQHAADEAEIQTICVEPRWRGRGLAKALLQGARDLIRTQNIVRLHLEVAADNENAIALYRQNGFTVVGQRKVYYARKNGPAVDAILMSVVP